MFTYKYMTSGGLIESIPTQHRSSALDAAFSLIDAGLCRSADMFEDGVKVGHCNVHGWFPTKDSILPQPLKETMSTKFSRNDADRLRLARETVQALEACEREALEEVRVAIVKAFDEPFSLDTARLVARHADSLRDALLPFDSGMRTDIERRILEDVDAQAATPRVVCDGFNDGVNAAIAVCLERAKTWEKMVNPDTLMGAAANEARAIAAQIRLTLIRTGGVA